MSRMYRSGIRWWWLEPNGCKQTCGRSLMTGTPLLMDAISTGMKEGGGGWPCRPEALQCGEDRIWQHWRKRWNTGGWTCEKANQKKHTWTFCFRPPKQIAVDWKRWNRDARGWSHMTQRWRTWVSSPFVAPLWCPYCPKGLQPVKERALPCEAQAAHRNISLRLSEEGGVRGWLSMSFVLHITSHLYAQLGKPADS